MDTAQSQKRKIILNKMKIDKLLKTRDVLRKKFNTLRKNKWVREKNIAETFKPITSSIVL